MERYLGLQFEGLYFKGESMEIKAMIDIFDIHKDSEYTVIDHHDNWVSVLDSVNEEFTLINTEESKEWEEIKK